MKEGQQKNNKLNLIKISRTKRGKEVKLLTGYFNTGLENR